jgi:tetratricopeptide (TPR) repeat protein
MSQENQGAEPPISSPQTPAAQKWVPVMADDVTRQRRRRIAIGAGIGAAILLVVGLIYRHSVTTIEGQQAQDDGARLYQRASYQQSILNLNRAIEVNPSAVEAFRMRAQANVAVRDYDAAIRDFTKVAELAPRDASAFVERGLIYVEKKDFPNAIADANRALAIDPKQARAYNLRGTAIRSMGDPEKALPDFNRAVDSDPSLANFFQRAATLQILNRHRDAIDDLDRAIEISPDQPHAYFARARSRIAVGDEQGAREDYRVGRKIDGW